jgi:hypothetical protein
MLVGMFTKYVLESMQKTELYKPRAPVESELLPSAGDRTRRRTSVATGTLFASKQGP